jgi:hypothetical protein
MRRLLICGHKKESRRDSRAAQVCGMLPKGRTTQTKYGSANKQKVLLEPESQGISEITIWSRDLDALHLCFVSLLTDIICFYVRRSSLIAFPSNYRSAGTPVLWFRWTRVRWTCQMSFCRLDELSSPQPASVSCVGILAG